MDPQPKKRQRVPASCLVCRKRKSKCDRVRPVCGTCRKKSIAHLCYFEKEKGSPDDEGHNGLPSQYDLLGTTDIPCDPQLMYNHQNQTSNHQGQLYAVPQPPQSHPAHGYAQPATQMHQQQHIPMQMAPQGLKGPPQPQQSFTYPSPASHVMYTHQLPQKMAATPNQFPVAMTPGQFSSHQLHELPQQPPSTSKTLSSPSAHTAPPVSTETTPRHTVNVPQPHLPPPPTQAQLNSSPSRGPAPPARSPELRKSVSENVNHRSTVPDESFPRQNAVPHSAGPNSTSSSSSSAALVLTLGTLMGHPPMSTPFNGAFPLPYKRPTSISNGISPTPSAVQWPSDIKLAPIQHFKVLPHRLNLSLVSVNVGMKTTLMINPKVSMDNFQQGSYSLVIDGAYWLQHGSLSYTALTKGDPFIKFFRSYAVSLFKAGELSKFLLTEYLKKRKQKKTERRVLKRTIEGGMSPTKRPNHKLPPQTIEQDFNDEEEMMGIEDSLIMSKIKISNTPKSQAESSSFKLNIPDPFTGMKALHLAKDTQRIFYDNVVANVVLQVLPSKKNTFVLFFRFFKYVAPFVPVVDENLLMHDLKKILPEGFPRFADRYTEINIKHENDLNLIVMLLIIIRLGYLSMLHNEDENNAFTAEDKGAFAEMSKINYDDYNKVLQLCLPEEAAFRKSSIKLVQALTLQYFYRLVAPEDCHGLSSAEGQTQLGTIIRHAVTIGLNREPNTFFTFSGGEKLPFINTWRNLWRYLVNTDAISSMHCGCPVNLTNLDISDVRTPTYFSKTGELGPFNDMNDSICSIYRLIVNKITNVRNHPKLFDILMETNRLEEIYIQSFGDSFFKDYILNLEVETTNENPHEVNDRLTTLMNSGAKKENVEEKDSVASDIAESNDNSDHVFEDPSDDIDVQDQGLDLDNEKSYVKVLKYITYVQLRTNLSCVYYMIAAHCEKKYDKNNSESMSAGIELYKLFIKSVVQLVYTMSYVLDHSVELFGKNYDYILTPINEKCMIKTHAFVSSFFIRLLHHIKDLTLKRMEDPDNVMLANRLDVLENLLQIVIVDSELFVGNFRKLLTKYVNSYRIYVMVYFVIKQCMANPEIFFEPAKGNTNMVEVGINMLQFFTIEELEQLGVMCAEFRVAKDAQNKMYSKENGDHEVKSVDGKEDEENQSNDTFLYGLGSVDSEFMEAGSDESFSSRSSLVGDPMAVMTDLLFSGNNPLTRNEQDLMKIFDVYNDLDQDSLGMLG